MTKMLIRALFDPNGGVEAYLEQLWIRYLSRKLSCRYFISGESR
jgi:hypothetical protein